MQETWNVWLIFPTICGGLGIVVISCLFDLCLLGNTCFNVGFVILLERMFCQEKQWGHVESCFFVFNVVLLERMKDTLF